MPTGPKPPRLSSTPPRGAGADLGGGAREGQEGRSGGGDGDRLRRRRPPSPPATVRPTWTPRRTRPLWPGCRRASGPSMQAAPRTRRMRRRRSAAPATIPRRASPPPTPPWRHRRSRTSGDRPTTMAARMANIRSAMPAIMSSRTPSVPTTTPRNRARWPRATTWPTPSTTGEDPFALSAFLRRVP